MPRALRLALAVALAVPILWIAPAGWTWIATEREHSPTGAYVHSLPFGCSLEFPREDARVLRWGSHRGARHGKYRCYDSDDRLRIRGSYRRGLPFGAWTAFDADGTVLVRGSFDRAGERHGDWVDTIEGCRVEIEYEHGWVMRWRLGEGAEASRWVNEPARPRRADWGNEYDRFADLEHRIRRVGLGTWSGPYWRPVGTWFDVGVGGRVAAAGPMRGNSRDGVWTIYDESGAILRQERYEPGALTPVETRVEPPWTDISPLYEPVAE